MATVYRERCINVHTVLDSRMVTAYREMEVNDQCPRTVQEPLEKRIYNKKRSKSLLKHSRGNAIMKTRLMCEEGLTRMKDTEAWPYIQRQQGLS